MKNECSIVGDLLALYQDGLVSEDTAAFVEEHLARCAVCRARLEQLRAPAAPQEAAQEERAFLAFAARWKKKRRRALAAFAAQEANPLYPVPRLMDAAELERFYYDVMEEKQ